MKRNDIILTGLIGSNPLGALSAFGLLRICDEIPALKGARLSWGWYHDWTAVLNTPGDICKDELLELMIARQQKRSLDIFGWSDDIKVDPKEYHEILKRQAEAATLHNRLDVDYFAAFGSDIVTARSTADVKPTAFHMTAGRQKFLNSIQKLGNSMKKDTKKSIRRGSVWALEVCRQISFPLLGPIDRAPACVVPSGAHQRGSKVRSRSYLAGH